MGRSLPGGGRGSAGIFHGCSAAARGIRGLIGKAGGGLRVPRLLLCLISLVFSALSLDAQELPQQEPSFLQRDSIRVVYWGDAERAAEQVLSAAAAPFRLPGIPEEFRLSTSTIFLAPTADDFSTLASAGIPEWAAGVAIPARRVIILPTTPNRQTLGGPLVTLRHEIAHLALNGYLGDGIPRWFDEGYATWASGGWDQTAGWQIRVALLRGQAPQLDSLALGWPRQEARARLAYLLSASAVAHLASSRGMPAFDAFLAAWRDSGDMDQAMRSVYQLTPDLFEREWRTMVKRRYGWLLALSQVTVLWFVAGALVFLLGIARRRSNRQRMAELEREEYMLPAVAGPERDGTEGEG